MLGTLDLKAALTEGETVFRPGLLSAAHGGVLYVDEVNLLPDHLVDVLLDVAASGINRVERDGVSHSHPARFVLVGSMNPEEGELRPQLLDRFGLSVEIKSPTDPLQRAEVVRRRLTHDAGGKVVGGEGDIVLRARLAAAMPADLPDTVVDFACRLAVSVGAEGLRADLVLCRAAAALAGWEGRSVATSGDVERVASVALGHRRRRRPFDPPILSPAELEKALQSARQSFADAYRRPEPAPAEGEGEAGPAPPTAGRRPTPPRPAARRRRQPTQSRAAGGRRPAARRRRRPTRTRRVRVAGGESPTAAGESDDDAVGEGGQDDASGDAGEAEGSADDGPDTGTGEHDPWSEDHGERARPAATTRTVEATRAVRATATTTRPAAPARGDAGPWGGLSNLPAPPPPPPPTAPTGSWQELAGTAFNALRHRSSSTTPRPAVRSCGAPPGGEQGEPGNSTGEARHGATTALAPERGRVIGDRVPGAGSVSGVALAATVRAAAQRRQADPDGPVVTVDDLREPVRSRSMGRTVVVAVDASGSMGTHRRVEAATGAVLGLLADAYLRRDRVSMVTFRGDRADVVLPPTASVELARARLAELPTGGITPLAEGITAGLSLARRAAADGWPPLLVLITDGRATGAHNALDRARAAAEEVAAADIDVVVVDAEDGPSRLGLAGQLASAMGARHVKLEEMSPDRVEAAVRDALR